ncbi:hypothetical protein HAX54_053071 [Datura stramonium]|uniref:Uncharacterized protein n=1 Tax=Datura stramonium TaxID=4076 RepID=A0ABS8WRG0_DATST|nr:hypothetical protein [Datura stramonium]
MRPMPAAFTESEGPSCYSWTTTSHDEARKTWDTRANFGSARTTTCEGERQPRFVHDNAWALELRYLRAECGALEARPCRPMADVGDTLMPAGVRGVGEHAYRPSARTLEARPAGWSGETSGHAHAEALVRGAVGGTVCRPSARTLEARHAVDGGDVGGHAMPGLVRGRRRHARAGLVRRGVGGTLMPA